MVADNDRSHHYEIDPALADLTALCRALTELCAEKDWALVFSVCVGDKSLVATGVNTPQKGDAALAGLFRALGPEKVSEVMLRLNAALAHGGN